MNPSELECRILSLLDGQLPPEQVEELEAHLRADKMALQTYFKLVQLHSALDYKFSQAPPKHVLVDKILAAQKRRIARGSLLAAAALLVLSGFAMWMILAPVRAVELGSIQTSSGAAFSLTYEGDGEAPEAGVFGEGSRLRLTEGSMEGVFKSGVRFVAIAPLDMLVVSKNTTKLEQGRVWFKVPAAAVGFTVLTAKLNVVDLGTDFGVVSSSDLGQEVHVFKGSVEVTAGDDEARKQTLLAGSARKLGKAGELVEITADPSLFQTALVESRDISVVNHSFEVDVVPRDGNPATRDNQGDDYVRDLVPSGWGQFSDGQGNTSEGWGIASTASDSYFRDILIATPDADLNDQSFFSAGRDIYQVLTERLKPNTTYILSVDVGDWRAGKKYDGAPGKPEIRLGVGAESGKGLLTAVEIDFPQQIDGQWVRWTATYTTGAAPKELDQLLRVELIGAGHMSWYDCVRLKVVHASSSSR
jgi:hypothetical protein